MSLPDQSTNQSSGRGCLVAAAAIVLIVAGLGVALYFKSQSDHREFERKQVERCNESVAQVKAGDDGSKTQVFLDSRLIEMLASDPECVANLTTLRLDMADLTGPQTAAATKLVNVKRISFYDCSGADNLLAAMKGMPSVEEIYIEVSRVSDDGVRLLGSFPNLKKVHFEQVIDSAREKLLRETLPGVNVQIPHPDAGEPKP